MKELSIFSVAELAVKMQKARLAAITLHGDNWKTCVDEWRPIFRACMKRHKCGTLEAVLKLCDIDQDPYTQITILGVGAELIENEDEFNI